MSEAYLEPDDTASLRLAAQLPVALMVVGAVPALNSQRADLAGDGYCVSWVATMAQALVQQELAPCSVLLVASQLPDGSVSDLIASIRAQSHSSYVYLIAQVVDETCPGLDADDWVAVSASREDLTAHLRAARRIVTMERSCRVSNESARLRELVDCQLGASSRQVLVNEAIRRLARLQRDDGSVALLLVRSGVKEGCLDHLADIANTLLDAGRKYNAVVARLSPVTFGLLLSDVDERAAAGVQLQITRRLSQVQSVLACGAALVYGPIMAPQDSFDALIQAAERTLQPLARAIPAEIGDAVGA